MRTIREPTSPILSGLRMPTLLVVAEKQNAIGVLRSSIKRISAFTCNPLLMRTVMSFGIFAICGPIGHTGIGWKVKVLLKFTDGRVDYFEGGQHEERLVRIAAADGSKHYFEGEKDQERTARVDWADGQVYHYGGENGAESLARIEFPSGTVRYYEGEKFAERRVRELLPCGSVLYYEGEQGAERKARIEVSGGPVCYFEGEKGAERAVRLVHSNGKVYFMGENEENGHFRWGNRVVYDDGRVVEF